VAAEDKERDLPLPVRAKADKLHRSSTIVLHNRSTAVKYCCFS
jgi:hypothetical protein